jgi:HEAT repeats
MSAGQRRPIDCGLRGIWWRILGVAGWVVAATGPARADIVELRGGGQIQGKVVPDPKNKDRVQVLLLQGRHPLSFQKAQIVRVIPKPSPLDDYVVKQAKAAGTAEAQYELGYWCEQNRLADMAKLHYEQALAFDPDFEPAHQKLGHTKVDGSWLTREDLSAAQGLVKYKGRWVTAEEKSKREDADKLSAAQGSWLRRIRLLRQALINGNPDRRREAESQLMAIRDPDAVVPLLRVFGQDDAPRRILLSLVLSTIAGPEATAGLVQRVLDESDSEVRAITFDHLRQRDDPRTAGRFVRALGNEDVTVINRAAWALGNLSAVDSVPRLVSVLVTTEDRIVVPPLDGGSISGPSIPVAPGLVPRAYNNFGVVATTPPVVSNGAVAMGLGVVPWYAAPPGYIPGGMAALPSKPPQDAHVETFTYRNVEVLNALQRLTGQDFGYDVDAWRRWITRSFNPHPNPTRRVPQP